MGLVAAIRIFTAFYWGLSNQVLFLQNVMTHKSWICLTTAVLSTILAPIASVRAATLPARKVKFPDQQPARISSPALPVISPLVVRELDTDVAVPQIIATAPTSTATTDRDFIPPTEPQSTQFIPTDRPTAISPQQPVTKTVPAVAKLPKLDFSRASNSPTFISTNIFPNTSSPIAPGLKPLDRQGLKLGKLSTLNLPKNPQPPQFISTRSPIAIQPSQSYANAPEFKPAIDSSAATPHLMPGRPFAQRAAGKDLRQVIAYTRSTPLLTFDRHHRQKAIVNTASAAAELAPIPSAEPNPIGVTELPELELPGFESGTPVFVFESNRPRRIVATAIAQVGKNGELAAPEPSISIPVSSPKNSTIPPQLSPLKQPTVIPVQPIPVQPATPATDNVVATQTGQASWYGLEAGPKTANGERYNPKALTAAHPSLPFGTKVRVTNLKNGQSVTVRINDRGPFSRRRIIDISEGAAEIIGIKRSGVGDVRIDILATAKPEMYN